MNEKPRRYSLFPKTLGQCVEPLTKPVFKSQGVATTRLITEWDKVVGKELAMRSTPQKLSFPAGKTTGGTLTIAAENGFATELQHMQPIILERLATYFGYKAVERLTISHTVAKAQPKPAPVKPKRPMREIDQSLADNAEDPDLKAALASFAGTLSGRDN